MENHGRKIRVFYANMLCHGLVIQPNGTGLMVTRTKDITISPVLADEIRKRAALLLEMLTPAPPAELVGYFYRLLTRQELHRALEVANRIGADVEYTQANGGWLLEMG